MALEVLNLIAALLIVGVLLLGAITLLLFQLTRETKAMIGGLYSIHFALVDSGEEEEKEKDCD